jgi:hypothetical protein
LQSFAPWLSFGSLGGKATFMILSRRSQYLTGGWTIFDMFFVALAAGLSAFLVSIFSDHERRAAVFTVSFFIFYFIFAFLFFFWLIPAVVRRQQRKRDKQK